MKTIYKTAAEAIERSITHDEIAFCDNTEENKDYLASSSDDYVETDTDIEYWCGDEWRVHIKL